MRGPSSHSSVSRTEAWHLRFALLAVVILLFSVHLLRAATGISIDSARVTKCLTHPNLFDYPLKLTFNTQLGFSCGLLALALLLLIIFDNDEIVGNPPFFLDKISIWFVLSIFTVVGMYVRFTRLSSIPWGFFLDEGFNALDSQNIRDGLYHPLFLTGNGGREALFFYFQAISIQLFGNTIFAVRAAAAFLGSLVVPAVFLLGRKMFSSGIGLIAAGTTAISAWQLHFSRIGFRYIMLPLITALAVWSFLRFIEKRNWVNMLIAATFFGIGAYTYVPYRLFPLIVLGYAFLILFRSSEKKSFILWTTLYLIISALVVLPLFYVFFVQAPWVMERVNQTLSIPTEGIFSMAMAEKVARSVSLFFLWGDPLLRHSIPTYPVFSGVLTAFWILGMLICLRQWKRPEIVVLLAWQFLMLLPTIISVGTPSSSRSIGAAPAAILIIALGVHRCFTLLQRQSNTFLKSSKLFFIVMLLGFTSLAGYQELTRYFHTWPAVGRTLPRYQESLYGFCTPETRLTKTLNTVPQSIDVYLSPQLFLHPTIKFLVQNNEQIHLLDIRHLEELEPMPHKIIWVIGEPITRNVWWIRNSPTKNMFFWEKLRKDYTDAQLANIIKMTYGSYTPVMTSDQYVLSRVEARFPYLQKQTHEGFTCLIIVQNSRMNMENRKA